jgi:hypothetical protein
MPIQMLKNVAFMKTDAIDRTDFTRMKSVLMFSQSAKHFRHVELGRAIGLWGQGNRTIPPEYVER